ncbi:cytidine and deoxycytidylate deaminase zinc-binding region protein (macronuclear) [Tetrahymena thermophila SB210]|uniref:Cytidine and deoxycytidylate deaminase zinc-binding region protein n=1 Tax=Tetrahymena thermophila (strain SB210) TaxID=312017 RepID=Q22TJ9_TETTS|nr:cytidine and deoxycytidylate deaminase zinc-binding region protein [Tetrahymena thermophila SB210]EAR88439.2 cytidine and deoxycytidylate deaminase zinc-binding region protein [Tetrahymena thermophila SB210]|eukprot:XP_001008684.2 cytidine and deoxycytidylate deaminase zinc-binding region protein [Tetrahymena thermophila SB210]
MQQLLPKEFLASANIQQAIVIEFENKKTNVMIKKYGNDQYFNLKNLNHIKRIRKSEENPSNVQFFLRLKDDFNEEVEQNIPEEINPYSLKEVEVAVNIPRTKEQYQQFNKYWPITYKVQQYEIVQFTDFEQQEINQVMRQCIDQAKQTYEKNNKFNACAIYDPIKKKILQFAVDETCRKQNSIKHCTMNVMKLFGQNYIVTAQQKASIEKVKDKQDDTIEVKQESQLNASQQEKKQPDTLEQEQEEEKKDKINSKRKSEESIEESLSSYYYCTGLDIFIVQEPCIMCSMALIHSRVRRVYYSLKNPKQEQFGGLNEDLMINHMDSLNHSFLVFQNVESEYANTTLNNLKQQDELQK